MVLYPIDPSTVRRFQQQDAANREFFRALVAAYARGLLKNRHWDAFFSVLRAKGALAEIDVHTLDDVFVSEVAGIANFESCAYEVVVVPPRVRPNQITWLYLHYGKAVKRKLPLFEAVVTEFTAAPRQVAFTLEWCTHLSNSGEPCALQRGSIVAGA
jgi:hypothetical protein